MTEFTDIRTVITRTMRIEAPFTARGTGILDTGRIIGTTRGTVTTGRTTGAGTTICGGIRITADSVSTTASAMGMAGVSVREFTTALIMIFRTRPPSR